jgi:hypothetical protein
MTCASVVVLIDVADRRRERQFGMTPAGPVLIPGDPSDRDQLGHDRVGGVLGRHRPSTSAWARGLSGRAAAWWALSWWAAVIDVLLSDLQGSRLVAKPPPIPIDIYCAELQTQTAGTADRLQGAVPERPN